MKTAVVTLMLMTLVQLSAVGALDCYQCGTSVTSFLCDGSSLGTPVTCPIIANACYKGYAEDGQISITARACAIIDSSVKLSCTSEKSGTRKATVCYCGKNLCNSALSLHGIGQHQMTLYALSVSASLLLAFFTR